MANPGRALLYVNPRKSGAPVLALEIRAALAALGIPSLIAEPGGAPAETEGAALAFSLGGDGTVLHAVQQTAPCGIPVIPVNMGSLGFIAQVHPGEWRAVFEGWREGRIGVSRRLMLDVAVERDGRRIFGASCLNDAVIGASGMAKLVDLAVAFAGGDISPENGAGMNGAAMLLGRYRSDGLIVATPTGSTAYSLSAGGPILDPEIEAVIINPICPFTLSNRPIVMPAGESLVIHVEREQRGPLILTADGQSALPLEPGDRVLIRRSSHDALLVASPRQGFYRALQGKLNWSGGTPRA